MRFDAGGDPIWTPNEPPAKLLEILRQQGLKALKSIKGSLGAWSEEIDANGRRS